jgi:hypothetical protein
MKEENIQNATVAELPKWDEFVNMVENEVTHMSESISCGYTVYHVYSKSC